MSYSSEVLADSPIGYWHLDETSGTVAADLGSGANAGTYVNTPPLGAAGLITVGTSVAFNLSGPPQQELTLPNNVLTTNGSIELWFKWTGTGTTVMRDSTSAGGTGWIIGFDNAGTFAVRVAATLTLNTSKTTAQVRDNNTHYLVITKSGANVVVYLDAVSIATSAAAANTASTAPWRVARNGTLISYAIATVDEVAIYSTALSAARVLAHYNAGIAPAPTTPAQFMVTP